jgi:hypothetical protein
MISFVLQINPIDNVFLKTKGRAEGYTVVYQ